MKGGCNLVLQDIYSRIREVRNELLGVAKITIGKICLREKNRVCLVNY